MLTLILDGEWNLKRNFLKRETLFAKGEYCGGTYGFLDSLRSVVNKIMPDRVVVMWDGPMSGKLRHDFYSKYKEGRNKSWDEDSYKLDEHELDIEQKRRYSILQNKVKIKNYLEELFIRQSEISEVEGDDLIALYSQMRTSDEQIIIFSSDKDYLQLIEPGVSILRPSDNLMITSENFKETFGYTPENTLALRCFEGDTSDNISGVDGIGVKTIMKYFPRFKDEKYTVDRIIQEAVDIYQAPKKKVKALEKIIGSRKVFERNKILMDLRNPFVNEEAKKEISEIRSCIIALEDTNYMQRSISNAFKMALRDGYNTLMWQENMELFFRPFYRLVAKEKEYTKSVMGKNN